jgi:two-component system, NtrC family, response regulator PilR
MQQLRQMIGKVARSQAPVHISGDSGTGKELAARLIHESGPAGGRAVRPRQLRRHSVGADGGELFGHKKGSFTGAVADKEGLIRSAEGGTLFLDEVADLPLHMQVKLLRVIQEKAIRPVGETREVPVDVRILSATHRKLEELVKAGKVPRGPLLPDQRHRAARAGAAGAAGRRAAARRHAAGSRFEQIGVPRPEISDEALEKLLNYSYPGNVRELENILERAVTLCSDDRIEPGDIQLKQGAVMELPPVQRKRGRTGSRGSWSISSARRSSRRWSRRGLTRPRRRSCWG